MQTGGILLLGGASTRMGIAKSDVDWFGRSLAAHVAEVLQAAVDGPVVAVAAASQALPELPAGVESTHDAVADQGPLRGLESGLLAIADRADVVFVASVDLPLLHPAFVHALFAALSDEFDAVVPVAEGHRHPLAAAYRTSVLATVSTLLAEGVRGANALPDRIASRILDEADLLALPGLVPTNLDALFNVNTPEDLAAARLRFRP
ncbi:MAG: molybdenum cofactor guanylyltransferase [Thermoleophilia bacterium]|nr:molybdenum cofactor guanylyltransferase [Thermoleophilia bacterium]